MKKQKSSFKVKIPITKYKINNKNNLKSLANLNPNETLFKKMTTDSITFEKICRTIGINGKKLNKNYKQISNKIRAIGIFNKNKNPKLSKQAYLCANIINDEMGNHSKLLNKLKQQSKNKNEFKKILQKEIKKIL